MSRPHILVVEDEPSFAEALAIGLQKEGFRISLAGDGAEALQLWRREEPDLVLLDIMLPKMSGIDVCREIRATSKVPIIMVTAKTSEIDAVVGLEVGADDYVTKPYRLRELVARIRAVLRRVDESVELPPRVPGERVQIGDVSVDPLSHEVRVRGELVHLPLKEFEVLMLLVDNAGRVLPREVIIDRAWGSDYHGDTKTLDVHIKRLRSKIEDDPANPKRIVTIRGLGYKYQALEVASGS